MEVVIYNNAANARSGAPNGILAVVTTLADIDNDQLTKAYLKALFATTGAGAAVTVGSIVKVHDGSTDGGRDNLIGLEDVVDIFAIDTTSSGIGSADTITNFDFANDKIQIGDGTGTPTVYLNFYSSFNRKSLLIYGPSAFPANDASRVQNGTLSTGLLGVVVLPGDFDYNDLTKDMVEKIFAEKANEKASVGLLHVLHEGSFSSGPNLMKGSAGVADRFQVDSVASSKLLADRIENFHTTETFTLGGRTLKDVIVPNNFRFHVRIEGDEMVFYNNVDNDNAASAKRAVDGADDDIIIVVTFVGGASSIPETEDNVKALFRSFNDIIIGTIVKVHDGASADTAKTLTGTANLVDVFKIDADYGEQARADVIKSFVNGTDLIDLGAGADDRTIYISRVGDDTVAYSTSQRGADEVMFVLEGITGLTDADFNDDDFIGDGIITVEIP